MKMFLIGMLLCATAVADVTLTTQEARAIKMYTATEFENDSPNMVDGSMVQLQFVCRASIYEDGSDFLMSALEDRKHKSVSCRVPIAYKAWFVRFPESASGQPFTVYCRVIGGVSVRKSLEVIGSELRTSFNEATIRWPGGQGRAVSPR